MGWETNLQLQSVIPVISGVESRKPEIEWLLELGIDIVRVANFGCHIGGETIALLWVLGAQEAVGIDKDWNSIDQATSMVKYFREDLRNVARMLQYYHSKMPSDRRLELESLIETYRTRSLPTFLQTDFTAPTELPADYFDLAYCERVLYHVACQETDTAMNETLSAVQEMERVVRPGGLVVAIEPDRCSRDSDVSLHLGPVFDQTQLVEYEIGEKPSFLSDRNVYCYSKT